METKHANFYHEHTIEHSLSDILVNQAQRHQSCHYARRLSVLPLDWRGSHHSPSKLKTLF